MSFSLDDIPVYETCEGSLQAVHFNHVQIALKHLNRSIRLEIPKLRTLDLILEDDAWIIVDRSLNDIPIAAWSHFQTESRDNLHEPIACKIRLYHMHAKIILNHTIDAMEFLLSEMLDDVLQDEGEKILPFKRAEE